MIYETLCKNKTIYNMYKEPRVDLDCDVALMLMQVEGAQTWTQLVMSDFFVCLASKFPQTCLRNMTTGTQNCWTMASGSLERVEMCVGRLGKKVFKKITLYCASKCY